MARPVPRFEMRRADTGFRILKCKLLHYSNRTGIADLTVHVDRDEADACGKIVRQPQDDLREARIGYQPHVLGGNSECLVISIDQSNRYRSSRLTLIQGQIFGEKN